MAETKPALPTREGLELQDAAEIALSSFENKAPAANLTSPVDILAAALKKVLSDDQTELDLMSMEDLATLEHNEDTVARSRQVYTLSLLKVLDFLRRPASTFGERAWQARLALQVVRHTEANSLERLKLGRTLADDRLEEQLAETRAEVERLARLEARANQRREQETVDAEIVAEVAQPSAAAEGSA